MNSFLATSLMPQAKSPMDILSQIIFILSQVYSNSRWSNPKPQKQKHMLKANAIWLSVKP
jgi:hypothetical protein